MNFFKNNRTLIFLFLFVVGVIPLIINNGTISFNQYKLNKTEKFKPELVRLNSIDKLISYTDSIYDSTPSLIKNDTALYVQTLSSVIKERFCHGLTSYSFSDNWIAYLLSKVFWEDFSAIVIPNDILKYPMGLCSQQTIVFMESLKLKHISVRSVGLGYKEGPGHFLCEVNYNGSWRLYDVTKEPEWEKITNKHFSMDYYLNNKDSLYLVYQNKMPLVVFNKLTEKLNYGKVNEFPAKKMLIFHMLTKILTYVLPLLFLLLFILSYKNKSR